MDQGRVDNEALLLKTESHQAPGHDTFDDTGFVSRSCITANGPSRG